VTIAYAPLDQWLKLRWPDEDQRRLVLRGYQSLKDQPLLLADIALHGGMFADTTIAANAHELAVAEGRRQLAARIIKAASVEPLEVQRFFTRAKPTGDQ
jgi:hypothetical protein